MSKQDYTTPEEIIESYKKYGKDFMVIDINKARPNDPKNPLVYYINVNFKSSKSNDLKRPVIKILNLTTSSSIKQPNERKYEQLKISVRKNDANNTESKFGEAMEIVCNTFKKKVKEMVDKKIISDDSDDLNSKVFPSVKPQTPMQTTAKNKEGKTVKLENPMFWFNINNKRYSADELKSLPKMKDMLYPNAYIKDFDINIYDLEKQNENRFDLATDNNGNEINNSNIQEFLKTGSIISGSIMFQCIISKNSFNLNTRLFKSLYVKKSNYNSNDNDGFDDDDMGEMLAFTNKLNLNDNKKDEKKESIEEEETISDNEDDDDEEEYEEVEETDDDE